MKISPGGFELPGEFWLFVDIQQLQQSSARIDARGVQFSSVKEEFRRTAFYFSDLLRNRVQAQDLFAAFFGKADFFSSALFMSIIRSEIRVACHREHQSEKSVLFHIFRLAPAETGVVSSGEEIDRFPVFDP